MEKVKPTVKPDVTLDCFGLTCPMPIFNATQRLKVMKVGEVIEVIATDEGIVADMPDWCRRTGNEFLGSTVDDGEYRVFVRKLVN